MKRLFLFVLLSAFLASAQTPEKVDLSASLTNPYSKGLVKRIAGYVLVGEGAIAVTLGVILDVNDVYVRMNHDDYLNMDDFNNAMEKAIWIEGAIAIGIGLPFMIMGHLEYSQWHNWQMKHSNLSFNSKGLTITF